jgi:hypothetical protein
LAAHHTSHAPQKDAPKARAGTAAPRRAVMPLLSTATPHRASASFKFVKVMCEPKKWVMSHAPTAGLSVLASAKPKLTGSRLPSARSPTMLAMNITKRSHAQRRRSLNSGAASASPLAGQTQARPSGWTTNRSPTLMAIQ